VLYNKFEVPCSLDGQIQVWVYPVDL